MADRFIVNPAFRTNLATALNRGVFELNPDLIRTGTVTTGLGSPGAVSPGAASPGTSTTQQIVRIQPGDLITADLINFILARLEALESRPVPGPTVPTVTQPTIVPTFPTATLNPTFATLNPTLVATFNPTVATINPTLVATFNPTVATINPTLVATVNPTFATINPTLVATFNPNFGGRVVQPGDTVRVIPGIGRAEEGLLVNAGINNVGALANAEPSRLADTLRVQPQEAASIIGIARGVLGPR